jgi:Zn-dependent M28 family amino/carboxypeptidase
LRVLITKDLEALGLEVVREEFEHEVPVTDDTPDGKLHFVNLYADLAGKPPAGDPQGAPPLVILATHIDTKYLPNFVGANDGGSSTAAVLELARGLVASVPRPVSYRFLFLDGEEAIRVKWAGIDNTYGSRHHAEKLSRKETFRRLKAFVLLDLVADADLVLTRDNNSDGWLKEIFYGAAETLGMGEHIGDPYDATTIKDDHLPFRALGVPVVDLIDLDYGPNNDYWHTSQDTLDKCSQESLQVIGDIVTAGLPKLEAAILERERSK